MELTPPSGTRPVFVVPRLISCVGLCIFRFVLWVFDNQSIVVWHAGFETYRNIRAWKMHKTDMYLNYTWLTVIAMRVGKDRSCSP